MISFIYLLHKCPKIHDCTFHKLCYYCYTDHIRMQNKSTLLIGWVFPVLHVILALYDECFFLILGMSTLEQKTDIFQELREKGLKTYLVCIYLYATCTEMCYSHLNNRQVLKVYSWYLVYCILNSVMHFLKQVDFFFTDIKRIKSDKVW